MFTTIIAIRDVCATCDIRAILITFKALTTQQQQYLSELIRYYEAPIRSRGVNILQTSATALDFSKRAFCHASPTVWNSLPQSVISDLTVTTGTFKLLSLNLLCILVPSCSDT